MVSAGWMALNTTAWGQAEPDSADPSGGVEAAPAAPTTRPPPPPPTGDSGPPPRAEADTLTPPRVLRSVSPTYPATRLAERTHPSVMVMVTLDTSGRVQDALIEHSADPDFDEAALRAVRTWTFAPAYRGSQPIASRIRVEVHFTLPTFDTAPAQPRSPEVTSRAASRAPSAGRADAEPERAEVDEASTSAADEPTTFGATARVTAPPERQPSRGAGSMNIDRATLAAAPWAEGADMLRAVPGTFSARTLGLAVAQRITLRGFDADHGQDIELNAGGLPINLPSHIHGQGYADLGFLIPEAVAGIRVQEGVADPAQGDFAVAGSVRFELGVEEERRGLQLASGYGRFNAFRQLALWAPKGESEGTFGAVQFFRTDGFGSQRRGDQVSAIVQAVGDSGSWRFRGLGVLYGTRADHAGVIRVDDIEAGNVGYYDAYPTPSAQAQNALSGRFVGGFFASYQGHEGDNGGFGTWVNADVFRLQQNFTGFLERSRTLGVVGRGDLIEQRNRTLSLGIEGRYHTAALRPWEGFAGRLEVGLEGRVDSIEQAQNLLFNRNQTWDERVDAAIFGTQLALYGDLELHITDRLRLHAGLRAAALLYEIEDRLGNPVPLSRPQDRFIVGYRRSAGGIIVGPRTSAEFRALPWLRFVASYGHGYRSPQARTLEDGELAPFTEVRAADLGVVLKSGKRFDVTLSGYWTELSDDIAFEAREGRLERIGASRRMGAVLYARARPWSWFTSALSVTYVDAELLEPPPPTAENPQPPFSPGQNLPYVPPLVVRADVGAKGDLLPNVLGEALQGRAGLGYSFLSERPLPFGGFASPVHLVDAVVGLGWGAFTLDFSVFNLFDTRFAATEFLFTSNWDSTGIPDRLPARHLAAGPPLSFMATLGVSL